MTVPLACRPAPPQEAPPVPAPQRASVPAQTPPTVSAPKGDAADSAKLDAFIVTVPASGYKLDFVKIPGDKDKKIEPFWMCTTETVWDAFDVYVFKLDEPEENRGGTTGADAKTHPSKPYLPPDRGFGHAKFATISVTYKSAEGFCAWLSGKTGLKFRLATEDEWEHACRAGAPSSEAYGFEGGAGKLRDYAWFKDNAEGVPHEVATKQPNAWGLYDMHGNVSEWVKGRDGKPAVKGGSYLDVADNLTIAWRSPQLPAWNSSDPQVPKSRWWLSDAPFVGFRVVLEKPAK